MEIAFITAEITPFSRHGSAADVCAALPKALRGLGHRVVVVSPLHADIDPTAHSLARRLTPLSVAVDGAEHACLLFDGRTTGGVDLLFIGHDDLATPHWQLSSSGERARAARLFGAAAAQAVAGREPAIEIVHAHGWFGAPALAAIREQAPGLARVLSLHDAIGTSVDDTIGGVLAEGIGAASRIIARSQSEALELARNGVAFGVPAAIESGATLTGIIDGVDAARWNPLTDASLPARFDPVGFEGKASCKADVQLARGLSADADVPLVVWLDANAEDAVVEGLKTALRNDMQLLVVGRGSDALSALAEAHPMRVAVVEDAPDELVHRAVAAADLALLPMPPGREAGLGLAAMRYGAVPVAPRVGALSDALVDCDAKLETGTGFVLDDAEPPTIAGTLERAVAAFSSGERFRALQKKAMRLDLSWERGARRYEQIYRELNDSAD